MHRSHRENIWRSTRQQSTALLEWKSPTPHHQFSQLHPKTKTTKMDRSIRTVPKRHIHIKLPFRFHTYSYCSNRIRLHCKFCALFVTLCVLSGIIHSTKSVFWLHLNIMLLLCVPAIYVCIQMLFVCIFRSKWASPFHFFSHSRSSLFTTDPPARERFLYPLVPYNLPHHTRSVVVMLLIFIDFAIMLLRDKKPSIIFIAHPMMVFMPRTIRMWAFYTLIWKPSTQQSK